MFCSKHLAVVTHYHPPTPSTTQLPFPPFLDPHPSPRYIQALVPGKLIGWNTELECREARSYNQANVWIQKGFPYSLCYHRGHVWKCSFSVTQ